MIILSKNAVEDLVCQNKVAGITTLLYFVAVTKWKWSISLLWLLSISLHGSIGIEFAKFLILTWCQVT